MAFRRCVMSADGFLRPHGYSHTRILTHTDTHTHTDNRRSGTRRRIFLGQALELEFGADLTIGPALEEGFYYDCFLGNRSLNDTDKEKLVKRMQTSIKEKHRFERVQITKTEALAMFSENKFKMEMI